MKKLLKLWRPHFYYERIETFSKGLSWWYLVHVRIWVISGKTKNRSLGQIQEHLVNTGGCILNICQNNCLDVFCIRNHSGERSRAIMALLFKDQFQTKGSMCSIVITHCTAYVKRSNILWNCWCDINQTWHECYFGEPR